MTDLSLLYSVCSHHSAARSPYKAPCPNNCQTTSSSTKQIETNTSLPYVASSYCEHHNILNIVGNFRLYWSLKIKVLLLPLYRFYCTILYMCSVQSVCYRYGHALNNFSLVQDKESLQYGHVDVRLIFHPSVCIKEKKIKSKHKSHLHYRNKMLCLC